MYRVNYLPSNEFQTLLKKQEKILVPKPKIAFEESMERIHQVRYGQRIQVIYEENGEYIQVQGLVSKINYATRILQIVKKKIPFDKIVSIEFFESHIL